MGQRDWLQFEERYPYLNCTARWSSRGKGRWWKRQLSKSRRRNARLYIAFVSDGERGRFREQLRYERECNWKLW